MPRFSRDLMIAQCVVFLATQVAMVWLHVPLLSLLGVGGGAPFGVFWQWLTHPLVEYPGTLLPFALAMLMAYFGYPRVERMHGRSTLLLVLLAATACSGILGTALATIVPVVMPVAGAAGPALGLVAYEAWARRAAGPARMSFFGAGPTFDLSGTQIVAGLFGFAALRLLLSRDFVGFGADVGGLLGSMAMVHLREARGRRTSRAHLRVVRGKGEDRDRMLH